MGRKVIFGKNIGAHPRLRIYAASAAFADMPDAALAAIGTTARYRSRDFAFHVWHPTLGPYKKPEFIEKYTKGLRLAGLPE